MFSFKEREKKQKLIISGLGEKTNKNCSRRKKTPLIITGLEEKALIKTV